MARVGGIVLKSLQWFLRFVEFCCAAVTLAIFSYFLATLTNHQLSVDNYIRAVEGISGIALCYTIIDVLLVCCLGGLGFFAFVALVLDIAFAGGFAFIAWYNRQGASTCNGYVYTPFGSGDASANNSNLSTPQGNTVLPSLHQACRLETAVFAVSIIAIVFFLISAVVEIGMWRHHQSEKKYGPSPANGYTSGSGKRRFWQRGRRNRVAMSGAAANPDALPPHSTPADMRTSYQTDNTYIGHEAPYKNTVV